MEHTDCNHDTVHCLIRSLVNAGSIVNYMGI